MLAERSAAADVLEHLVEIDRRRLYLEQACGSLQAYCMAAHNAHTARRVFGEAFVAEKRALRALSNEPAVPEASAQPDNFMKVQSALMKLGFRRQDASRVISELRKTQAEAELEPLLRAALGLLTPPRG